jgi:Ribbon-helix-helix protein, copG family.
MAERKTERLSIRLTKALRRRLEKLAADDRRKLSTYIEIVLEEHADRKGPK